ncbi:MAG: PqqD family protein [Candidatus Krumholzibacteriia bacterium]
MAKDVRNFYELIPRQKWRFEERGDGTVDVLMPRYGGGPVGGVLKRFLNPKPVRVQLDEVGACVWRLCDGRRSVHEIGESLHEHFGERIEPVYDRLGVFLEHMRKNGLIDWKR